MKCWYCNAEVIWQSDWNYDEIHGEGEGIVSLLACSGCGAEVQFSLRENEEE